MLYISQKWYDNLIIDNNNSELRRLIDVCDLFVPLNAQSIDDSIMRKVVLLRSRKEK